MPGKLDGTVGEAALAMAPGELLVIQRVGDSVILTVQCEPLPGAHKAVEESISVNLIPPESRAVNDVTDAVVAIFRVARGKVNRSIERGNRGQVGDEPSAN